MIDTCGELLNEKDVVELAKAGRHKNVHVFYVKHNLFQQKKQPYNKFEYNPFSFVQITSILSTN